MICRYFSSTKDDSLFFITKHRILLFFLFVLVSETVFSQSSNVVFFSDDQSSFYVYLNGEQRNKAPSNRVKIESLNAERYFVRIRFKNKENKDITREIYFRTQSVEQTYLITKNQFGQYSMRFYTQIPVFAQNKTNNPQIIFQKNQTYQKSYYTRPFDTTLFSDPNRFSLYLRAMDDTLLARQFSGWYKAGDYAKIYAGMYPNQPNPYRNKKIPANKKPKPVNKKFLNNYKGNIGCYAPLEDYKFQKLLSVINSKSFETTKLNMAKQSCGNKCFRVSQICEIIRLFSFESSKLEFAKYAYHYCFDIDNYFQVNEEFTFEASADELNEYIKTASKD